MKTDIYKSDSFKNHNIPFLFNKDIVEYDMKDAGYSLVQEFDLLPKNIIDNLGKMKKKQRTIEIGKIQGNDEEFKNNLQQAFSDARKLFFDINDIDINEVLSIKRKIVCL